MKLLVLFLFFILLITFVASEGDDKEKDKSKDDAAEDDDGAVEEVCDFATQEQKIEAKLNNKHFELKSAAKSGKCGIKTDIKFGCDGQCSFEGKFKSKDDATKDRKEGLKITLNRIAEIDAIASPYNEITDDSFGSFSWPDVACSCDDVATTDETVLSDCAGLIKCTQAGTKDYSGEIATITLTYYVSAKPMTLGDGYLLQANTVKFDLAIENWQYASASNFLAVEAEVSTKRKLRKEDGDDDDAGDDDKRRKREDPAESDDFDSLTAAEKERRRTRGTKHVRGVAAVDAMGLWWTPEYTNPTDQQQYNVSVIDNPQSNDAKKIVFVFEAAGGQVDW